MATTQTTERGLGRRRSGPPLFIWLPAAAVALLMLVPPFYLAVRAAEAGTGVFDLLFNMRTLGILVRTGLLMALVTAVCVALGVSLAWLTVRTDMPLRRTFAVLTTLPLVVPSYVFALIAVVAIGPRGMVQSWLEPLGVERLPSIYGLSGSVLILSLLSFPYVMLPVRAALHRADPAMEEAARSLGKGSWETFSRVTFPLLRPAIIAGALLVALYTLSDFGAVSLLRFNSFTRAIYVQYQAAFDRTPAAVLALMLVGVTVTILAVEA
jgi:iron(III) transport system permease protein